MRLCLLRRVRVIGSIALLVLSSLCYPAWAAQSTPLVFGVFPNLSTQEILTTYRPLADVLEKQLHRRVMIYTAPDFRTFAVRTRDGAYDLILTAPHLAWLARQEAGYRPLLQFNQPVRGLLVVKQQSTFNALSDLKNHHVATADRLAITVLAMQEALAAHGLKSGLQFRQIDAGTHSNAAMQVIMGRVDAAIVGRQPFNHLPDAVRAQLRVIAETPPLSSQMFLSHPRVSEQEALAIHQTLLDFERSPEGQRLMQRSGFGALMDVHDDGFSENRRYALEAQRLIRAAP